MSSLDAFREVWFCDFEFHQLDGERPDPLCLVARELRSGRLVRLWRTALRDCPATPFPIGPDSLFIAYYAAAELGCFLALGWPMPARILDLFAEFRCLTNGLAVPCGNGLLGALAYFGLDAIDAAEKDGMRALAMRGGEYTAEETHALLDYCQSDVDALAKLLPVMLPHIDLPRALLRGRYMAAAARMEWAGVPIDAETLAALKPHWIAIQSRLVEAIDADYGVFVPTELRTLPTTLIEEASRAGVDPFDLRDAADYVLTQSDDCERREAIRQARHSTRITHRRAMRWEDSGKDYATWPGLDVQARELAGEWPSLGIGPGYDAETLYDDKEDHAGGLWALLRQPDPPRRRRTDPDVIRDALELLSDAGPTPRANGRRLSFSADRFAAYLATHNIPWPRLPSGALDLSDDVFRQMAKAHPAIAPLRELRHSLSQLRLNDLAVGSDGRNRCLLSAFQARTSRNQPSNARFIFGPSVWLRGLIKPQVGRAVAYVDWEQQEFGIAAALSGDKAMRDAYESGDPYLSFAKQAGAVPKDATKETHKTEREQFKVCALAVQYGMAEASLAQAIGRPVPYACELLRLHRQTYPTFWRWSESAVSYAMLHGRIWTVFGWTLRVGPNVNARSIANFPMQANGAEMLRLACCLATEAGIAVCAPVHDAILVEGPAESIESIVAETQAHMCRASEIVLAGFPLRTDADIVRYPDRYCDPRGESFWNTVMGILADIEQGEDLSHAATPDLSHDATGTCRTALHPCSSF